MNRIAGMFEIPEHLASGVLMAVLVMFYNCRDRMLDINREGERFISHMVSIHHGGQGKVEQLNITMDRKQSRTATGSMPPQNTPGVTLHSSSPQLPCTVPPLSFFVSFTPAVDESTQQLNALNRKSGNTLRETLYQLLSLLLGENIWQKQLEDGETYSTSQCEGKSIMAGKVWRQEHKASNYNLPRGRKQRVIDVPDKRSPFYSVQTPFFRMMPPRFKMGLPISINIIQIIPYRHAQKLTWSNLEANLV